MSKFLMPNGNENVSRKLKGTPTFPSWRREQLKGIQLDVKHCSICLSTRQDQDVQPDCRETYWASPWSNAEKIY